MKNLDKITDSDLNKKLIDSELRYRRLFETAQDGVLLLDYETGMILDVNPFLIDMLGHSKNDFLKKHLWEVGVFKDIAASKKNFFTLQKKKYVRFENLPLETKSRIKINVEFVANAYQVDGTTIIQCNIRDITDRKKVEEALRQSEEKFSKVFHTSPYAILITLVKDGKIIDTNEAFTAITGFTREEALSSSSIALKLWVNENDRQLVIADLHAGRPVMSREYMFRMKNGEILIGLYSAQIVQLSYGSCILSSVADITERKKMEQRDYELKTRDEAVLSSIDDAVLACDNDGKILLFNKTAETMTGISAKKAIGSHYNQIVSFIIEGNEKVSNNFITEAIKSNKIRQLTNHVLLVRKDGQKIPVANSAAPIKDINGKIIGCVAVFHDVTKERQIDKAKTEFVSLASHQLRTPLSTINWYTEMLLSEDVGKLTPKQQQYSQEIYHASQRMVRLVNALLNVSRLELGTFVVEPECVNIVNIAKTCLEELNPQILKKKLRVTQKYSENMTSVKIDPKFLTIIIQNFLSNSVKYSPDGGEIGLTISKKRNTLWIAVSDTGIGIPKEQKPEIFSKLFRADNAKKTDPNGSGLGLYIVKEITHYVGGKIWFRSSEGKGTIFYARLPLSGFFKKSDSKRLN